MSTQGDFRTPEGWERGREHVWRYFELHAGQRMAMFNFFTVATGVTLTGLGATLQASSRFSTVGVGLGLLLSLFSFAFWKIDQRVSFLIQHAEQAHAVIESNILPIEARIFHDEPTAYATANRNSRWFLKHWTFGRVFRSSFFLIFLIGLVGATLSGLRAAGYVSFEKEETKEKITHVVVDNGKDEILSSSKPKTMPDPIIDHKKLPKSPSQK